MGITVGEIFQSFMAGVSLLTNVVFVLVVALACFDKVTWFYDLVNIRYSNEASKRSLQDSTIRLILITLSIITEALAGKFTRYGIFGEIFSIAKMLTLFAIFGQIYLLIKSTRNFEKKRKEAEERIMREIEESKQSIRENLNQHAIAIDIDIDPEEFFEKMEDPEEFKKWLKEHSLQLTEEDRMMMSPEEEKILVEMGFLPPREEVAEASEKTALDSAIEPKKREPEKDEDFEKESK